jgi:hypothetical protein
VSPRVYVGKVKVSWASSVQPKSRRMLAPYKYRRRRMMLVSFPAAAALDGADANFRQDFQGENASSFRATA